MDGVGWRLLAVDGWANRGGAMPPRRWKGMLTVKTPRSKKQPRMLNAGREFQPAAQGFEGVRDSRDGGGDRLGKGGQGGRRD